MENNLPFNWDWVRVVVVYSLTVFAVSSAILVPSLKLLNSPRLGRLPTWLRWVLVLPVAFLVGYISETIPRILFATIEIAINHQLTFRPGVDCLIWQAYSPIFFVIGGMKMAPSHRFSVFVALGGLKIAVAILNIYNVVSFTNGGGGWDSLDPIIQSPLWWNVPVYVLCIVVLVVSGVYLSAKSRWNPLKDKLKDLGYLIMGFGIFAGLIFLGACFIYGAAWASVNAMPWLYRAFFMAFGFALFISLPLSFFHRTRPFSASSFLIISYIFGINLWCFALLVTMVLWGTLAVIVGLFLAGVGIVPVALIATAFKGEWEHFFNLIFLLVLTFGCRELSIYLGYKIEQAHE